MKILIVSTLLLVLVNAADPADTLRGEAAMAASMRKAQGLE